MGAAMAQRLLDAGHRLRVYNRTAARAAALVERGALIASSAREACEGAQAVVSMVADDDASRAVWTGADGILAAALSANALAIECSTLSHDWVLELGARAAKCQLRYLDAPVTGLPADAAAGELTLLVGAHAADLAAAHELFAAIARRVQHFGPVGAGTAYKLMVNLLGAVQIASAAEGMALAERAGLALHTVADAIAGGQAASPQVLRNTRRMADADYDRNVVFTAQLRAKDVDYALRLARKLGLGTPFGQCAAQVYQQLCAQGFALKNESAILEIARRQPPQDAPPSA